MSKMNLFAWFIVGLISSGPSFAAQLSVVGKLVDLTGCARIAVLNYPPVLGPFQGSDVSKNAAALISNINSTCATQIDDCTRSGASQDNLNSAVLNGVKSAIDTLKTKVSLQESVEALLRN